MVVGIEDRLRDLRRVIAASRNVAADIGAAANEAAAARRPIMRRLARDLERVAGIELSEMTEVKLARVLASVDIRELDAWVRRLHLLPRDHPEWLSLIESLTVHETFFHRDRSQLELLAQILPEVTHAAADAGRHRLRLWSAGCATGEEAYTLAILALLTLHDAGFADRSPDGGIVCRPPWRLEVLGTDISRLVLAQARAAIYSTEGLSAFRDLPTELQRFFPVLPRSRETGDAELRGVLPSVRQHVRFDHFNLIAGSPPQVDIDVVLCRNVMIYLTPSARAEVQAMFKEALRPGGHLLLGPTDALAEPAAYQVRWGTGAIAYALKPRDG